MNVSVKRLNFNEFLMNFIQISKLNFSKDGDIHTLDIDNSGDWIMEIFIRLTLISRFSE